MPNGIDLILADHERVNELFAEFDSKQDGSTIGLVIAALKAHDEAEQAALYPMAGTLLGAAVTAMIITGGSAILRAYFETVTGRVVTADYRLPVLRLASDPLSDEAVEVRKDDIVSYVESEVSPMPPGLLDTLTREEILDLLAYIELGGGIMTPRRE